MKCPKCGTEFVGNFCSNCGLQRHEQAKKCPRCGMEYAGKFCSNCGYSATERKPQIQQKTRAADRQLTKSQRVVCYVGTVAIFISLICLLWVSSRPSPLIEPARTSTPTESSSAAPDTGVISVGTSQLIKAYQDNEINANELYLDKVLKISGTIESIGVDVLNQNYITVGDGSGSFIDTVHCNLADEQTVLVSSLEKGDTVTIQGTYVKNVVGVMLDDCEIISAY